MGIDLETGRVVCALAFVGFGLYGLFKGELGYGPENGPDHLLIGNKARLVSSLLVAAGVALLFSALVGLSLFAAVFILSWLLRERL